MSTLSYTYGLNDILADAICSLMAPAGVVKRRRPTVTTGNEMPASFEDIADVNACLNGDGQAYARVVARYQDVVTARMWRFTRDAATLEELVHEVFVQAYLSLRTWRAQSPLIHWLNRIATRCGYRLWTRQAQDRAVATMPLADWDGASVADASSGVESREASDRLHQILRQLPPRDRLVITLMHIEQLSVEDIAKQTGWSKTMVKVQAWRARKKLRKILEPLLEGKVSGDNSDHDQKVIPSEK